MIFDKAKIFTAVNAFGKRLSYLDGLPCGKEI